MAKKILFVEDDLSLQKAVRTVLEEAGFDLAEALNGQEGLAKALTEHPDLILLDLIMPKMDGITMLNKLREDEWGKSAEVIILTNLNSEKKLLEAVGKNVYDYYLKTNWEIDDIVTLVKKKLGEAE